jgi:penicillin-binding protein 1A
VIRILLYAFLCFLVYTLGLAAVYYLFNDNLPDLDELEGFQPKHTTKVFSVDGQHLKDFFEENRENVTLEEIPQAMRDALIATEDRRFFSHWGVDVLGIFRAVSTNLRSLSFTAQGASTLTQQLAGNLFEKVGRKRGSANMGAVMATYARKVREQITAVNIERLYTKQEILTMYLNTVNFGHNHYGLKAAAHFYFDKEVQDLKVEDCALLVGLLPAPTHYSPLRNPRKALERRNLVLRNMADDGKLSRSVCNALRQQPLRLRANQRSETYDLAPYFIENVRQQLEREYGPGLYRDGLTIRTTLDTRLQRIAEKHFAIEIGKVQEQIDKFLAGRSLASDYPESAIVQAAFVALDPRTGHILAMIGGRDFDESKFNRATQALRLPGSAFKPFVYAAAVDNGRFATDVVDDNAITVKEADGTVWDPENYDRTFKGPMTLRKALAESRNLVAIKLAMELGPERIKGYARSMGIRTPISPVYSLGVGTSAVHLLDLVAAYCVFPNKGDFVEPVAVEKVLDEEGSALFEASPGRREVLRPAVAVVLTDMLRSVIDDPEGTAYAIRSNYHFGVAAAGKTGTTNDYTDAWFIGFTPHLAAGVWVGMDDPRLGLWPRQAGSVAALPLWVQFMQEVYSRVDPYRRHADESFDYPANLVVRLPVCDDSHRLATRYCPRLSVDIFLKDGAQPDRCPLHSTSRTAAPRPLQHF